MDHIIEPLAGRTKLEPKCEKSRQSGPRRISLIHHATQEKSDQQASNFPENTQAGNLK